MKKYLTASTNALSSTDQDIAKMDKKSVEESLVLILQRVIDTMLSPPGENRKKKNN